MKNGDQEIVKFLVNYADAYVDSRDNDYVDVVSFLEELAAEGNG